MVIVGDWEIKVGFNLLPAKSLLRDFHVVPGSCSLSSLLLSATSGPCLTTDPRGTHASFSSCCELRGDVPTRSPSVGQLPVSLPLLPGPVERGKWSFPTLFCCWSHHSRSLQVAGRALFLVEWDFWASGLPKLAHHQMLFCVVTGTLCPHLSHACHLT